MTVPYYDVFAGAPAAHTQHTIIVNLSGSMCDIVLSK